MRLPYRLIVVRRGQVGTFQAILQGLGRWPTGTAVMWDRRERERRHETRLVQIERRTGQRRAPPDAMWYTHGFLMVETARLPPEAVLLQPLTGGSSRIEEEYSGANPGGLAPQDRPRPRRGDDRP